MSERQSLLHGSNGHAKDSYDDSSSVWQPSPLPASHFVLYKRRFGMLVLFCLCCILGSCFQNTFAPTEELLAKYYGVSSLGIDLLALNNIFVCVPGSFLASYAMEKKGLRWVVNVGTIIMFWLTFSAQLIGGLSLPFMGLGGVPLLASNWFGESERALAGTVAVLSQVVGPAIVFGIGPLIVTTGEQIKLMLLGFACVATLIASAVLVIFRGRPPTAPSATAFASENAGDQNYFQNVKACLTNLGFWQLTISFGVGYGAFTAIQTLIDQIVTPEGYAGNAGLFGVILVVSSVVGALVVGFAVDRTRAYMTIIRIVGVLMVGSIAFFTFSLKPDNFVVMCICNGLLGFFTVAVVPCCLELSVEITFPVPEGTSSSILNLVGNATSIAFIFGMNALQDPVTKSMRVAMYVTAGIWVVCMIPLMFYCGKYKRLEHEKSTGSKLVQ